MNPQLTYELDFSFFKNLFSSKNDEKEKKTTKTKKTKEKEEKEEKEEKKGKQKNIEKQKISSKQNISKKDSNKSSETAYTEEENNNIKKNANEKEEKIIINKIYKNDKKEAKIEKNIIQKEKTEEDLKNNEDIKEEDNNIIKEKKRSKSLKKKKNKKVIRTKDELLNNLVNYIKNVYIFRKKVKALIKKHKENYAIISSVNNNNLSMNIYVNEEKIKKLKYIYEPILNQNIFYIPRKNYKKKNLLKFSFVNNKNESIIDPKFNTEYDAGEFINVINLKKIKDKEEEKEEEFQSFLETYYTLKPALSKESIERNKLSLEYVRVKKKHRTMDNQGGLLFGGHKFISNSILKQRPMKRVTSNKKISFSEKNETISYKKED